MKITKTSCDNCNSKKEKGIGYTWMPKDKDHSGHMDTQMYPECEGTKYDRNIQKKQRKHKKTKTAQSNIQKDYYCSKCGVVMGTMSEVQWKTKGGICDACGGRQMKIPVPPKPMASLASAKSLYKMAQTSDIGTKSEDEKFASQMLSQVVNKAMQGDVSQQQYLSHLWDGESWDSIQSKVLAEGESQYEWWLKGVRKFLSESDSVELQNSPAKLSVEAKKKDKKKWNPNPWAVCTKCVGRNNEEKYERCVMDVKKKQASDTFNLSKYSKSK